MPPRSHFVTASLAKKAADNQVKIDATFDDPLHLGFVLTMPCLNAGAAGAWPVANAARFVRAFAAGTITKVGLHVGTASGNVSVAVFRSGGAGRLARPTGAPVAASGAVACPAAGYAEIALGSAVKVEAGDWIGLSCDNTTATFMSLGGSATPLMLGVGFGKNGTHPINAAVTFADTDATMFRAPQLIGVP